MHWLGRACLTTWSDPRPANWLDHTLPRFGPRPGTTAFATPGSVSLLISIGPSISRGFMFRFGTSSGTVVAHHHVGAFLGRVDCLRLAGLCSGRNRQSAAHGRSTHL